MPADAHMTLAEFKIAHPEFCKVSDSMVRVKLDHAAERTDAAALRGATNEAHGLLTAHLLAAAPHGQQARLVSKDGSTTYSVQHRSLIRTNTPRILLSGGTDGL